MAPVRDAPATSRDKVQHGGLLMGSPPVRLGDMQAHIMRKRQVGKVQGGEGVRCSVCEGVYMP